VARTGRGEERREAASLQPPWPWLRKVKREVKRKVKRRG